MNWFLKQLTSPSTHNALAAVSASLTPIIPPPYGIAATAFFALLGTIIPESGEGLPVPMPSTPSQKVLPFAILIAAGIGTLVACTVQQVAQSQSAACVAQSVLNAAAQSGQNAGDAKLASGASMASTIIGNLCTGLAADTPLTVTPAPVNALPTKPAAS